MRLTLLLLAPFASLVAARRGLPTTNTPPPANNHHYISDHEYPYGWGLDDEVCVNEMNHRMPCKSGKVKEVKSVVKNNKDTDMLGNKVDHDPFWKHVDDIMLGLE